MKDIKIPDDVWQGTESHPQCCFFELFPSSYDPEATYYDVMVCHLDMTEDSANICKGDYLKCPLSHNKKDGISALRSDLARVTAERDRLRKALENIRGWSETGDEYPETVGYILSIAKQALESDSQ